MILCVFADFHISGWPLSSIHTHKHTQADRQPKEEIGIVLWYLENKEVKERRQISTMQKMAEKIKSDIMNINVNQLSIFELFHKFVFIQQQRIFVIQ